VGRGHTSAISILSPLGRPLKVGGKREKRAKWILTPRASTPSNVTVKLFAVSGGACVGVRVVVSCVQDVVDPEMGMEDEARGVPEEDWRERVMLPRKAWAKEKR
jgi:hypothetical protein